MSKIPKPDKNCVLAINGGSSSIKFALYEVNKSLDLLLSGQIENIGSKNTKLHFKNAGNSPPNNIDLKTKDHDTAINLLIDWLEKQVDFSAIKAIGHRIVHGMQHTKPEVVSPDLLADLKKISAYDPDHLPEEIKMIEVFGNRYPSLVQIACFDTSFHSTMPPVAKLLAIPRRFNAMGIQRYGFHGLSYAYLMEQLRLEEGIKY